MTFQTFTGREYLKIDIASNFGLEKRSWDERLAWFDQNEVQLEQLVPQAEEPALYFAGVKAWRDTQAGRSTGYMISLDATSSGLQLLAALSGDRRAAELCNVVDTGYRKDAYHEVYAYMLQELGETGKISRADTKDAIMTSLYGSTAVPKQVFGEGRLLDLFFNTMKEVAPGAWELNEAFLAMWNPNALSHDWVLPDNFHVHVKVMETVKDRVHFLNQPFDVYYKVNQPMDQGRSLGANTIHSVDGMIVREITRRCDYNPTQIERVQQVLRDAPANPIGTVDSKDLSLDMAMTLWAHFQSSGYLSARILDYITPGTIGVMQKDEIIRLIASLPKQPFKVVSIHDCFRCHPNYGNDLRRQYNLQLALIAKSNLLEFLVSQIIGRPIQIWKLHPDLYKDVLHTNYALS